MERCKHEEAESVNQTGSWWCYQCGAMKKNDESTWENCKDSQSLAEALQFYNAAILVAKTLIEANETHLLYIAERAMENHLLEQERKRGR